MNNIYLQIFTSIAPALISILREEAKKTTNTIDDKLVNVLEAILIEFNLIKRKING